MLKGTFITFVGGGQWSLNGILNGMISILISNLAKNLFHDWVLVLLSTKGCQFKFESHELKLELLVLILQIRYFHNVGLY